MKSKTTLSLMEQLIMILVLALAAALCLQIFAAADRISRQCQERDRAAIEVQNAAELLKIYSGDTNSCAQILGTLTVEGQWQIFYTSQWQQTSEDLAVYRVLVLPAESENELLESADISAQTVDNEVLFQLTASWQKAVAYE